MCAHVCGVGVGVGVRVWTCVIAVSLQCVPHASPSPSLLRLLARTQQVLGVGGGDDQSVTYALLQPITSLRAALTHIRPAKSTHIKQLLKRAGRPPCSTSEGLSCHGEVGGGVASVAASEMEIHANLSLLFPRQPQPTSWTEGEMEFTMILVTG